MEILVNPDPREWGPLLSRPQIDRSVIGQRVADISRHMSNAPGVFKNFAQKGRGSGLAVGAGNGQHIAVQQRRGQFQLAYYGNAFFLGNLHYRCVDGHAGADHQNIRFVQQLYTVLAQAEHTGRIPQTVQLVAEGFFQLHIRQNGNGSVAEQQLGGGNAAAGHAHHQHTFLFKFHDGFSPPKSAKLMDSISSGEERTERSGTKGPPQRSTWPRSAVRSCRRVQSDDGWATF